MQMFNVLVIGRHYEIQKNEYSFDSNTAEKQFLSLCNVDYTLSQDNIELVLQERFFDRPGGGNIVLITSDVSVAEFLAQTAAAPRSALESTAG